VGYNPRRGGKRRHQEQHDPQIMQKFIADNKPEAAYFFADDQGNRSSLFVLHLKDTSDIPVLAWASMRRSGSGRS
jgi:hypothetical protein